MEYILFGAAGAVIALGLVALGFFIGWKAGPAWRAHTARVRAQEASEEERRQLIEEQQAFRNLLGYNTDTAYGLNRGLREMYGGDGA